MAHPEALAEVTLAADGNSDRPASPVASFGFIVSVGDRAFSSAVVPDGSGHLQPNTPAQVKLRFLVPEAADYIRAGLAFTFFECGRRGAGQILQPLPPHLCDLQCTHESPSLRSTETVTAIKNALKGSSLIVMHRIRFGGCAPDCFVFDDYEDFEEYLRNHAKPGDDFWFWRFNDLCRDDNAVANGKYPDAEGKVPFGGAY